MVPPVAFFPRYRLDDLRPRPPFEGVAPAEPLPLVTRWPNASWQVGFGWAQPPIALPVVTRSLPERLKDVCLLENTGGR